MGYGPRRVKRARAQKALRLVAQAGLAGMKMERHNSVSRRWAGSSHTIWSTTIDGVRIYRASMASLARVYLELLP